MLANFILKIKMEENKVFSYIYHFSKAIINFSFPCIRPLHRALWWERQMRLALWRWLLKGFYYTPMFTAICYKVGKNLNLVNGMPSINENVKLVIGDNVTIWGDVGIQGYKVIERPLVEIGDNTFIGPQGRIGVGKHIKIGKHCLIAARVFISDHDGHPLDYKKRRQNLPVDAEEIKPVTIEDDVWIGEGAFICKGVKIGRGAVIGARSVVTKDVEPFTIVVGNPAKKSQ